ncbi:protein-disulfide reductase DsbD [Stappia stellulata]|uniref:protein-disulfide reductase DsbD n=1 Tax=Stappia stellulata TaxID=71235 RepID=UPI000422F5EF|nr:protein-disulfide reductase DsbD [Stappia stellulata]
MKLFSASAFALLALVLLPSAGPAGAAPAAPLPVSEAFELDVARDADGALVFSWDIAPGYYLYRDHISAQRDETPLPLSTPPGTPKDDPVFGPTQVYTGAATARLETPVFGTLELTFQGCQDDGICYAPETRHVDAQTLEVSAPAGPGGPGALGTGPEIAWTVGGETAVAPVEAVPGTAPGAGSGPADAGFELAASGGLVEGLLERGGVLLVLASFPLFGLLLAFTPCVFPMYPILAGALAREGDKLTARRGFVLSSIYVLSLSTAFGLLGAAAGWSGQNLQLVLQSPITSGILAALFAVLALSMFGLFELQLPGSWTNWVAARTGGLGGSGGSKRSTALLGFSSALIVGPCVTVPLAGALLYIAQTADVGLGAAALFGLGLGKGLPLIVMGTLGGQALPRAGAWMEGVKQIFGFGFLATAIWTVAPLLPSGVDLALWAALLIAVASFAVSVPLTNTTALASMRAVGGLALVYGVILLIGASAGGTDPLKPLAPLAQRGGSAGSGEGRELRFAATGSISDLQARLASANGERSTMVYFTADWCVTCRVIERSVFPDPQVRQSLGDFQLVKADLTDFNAENSALMKAMRVAGPPTMIFFDGAGREAADTRLVGSVTVDALTRSAHTTERL